MINIKDLEKEIYTLEELRLMKQIDGTKKLVFLDIIKKKMSEQIIIQREISITQTYVDKCIVSYSEMPASHHMGLLGWTGNRDAIIREIKNLTKVGRAILKMRYKYEEFLNDKTLLATL